MEEYSSNMISVLFKCVTPKPGIEVLAVIVKPGVQVEAHSAHLLLWNCLVFLLVELAGRIKDLFSVKRLVYHSELHSDTERTAKQFLFIGILQIDMCIDEKPDSFGKDDHPDAMIGFPDLQWHIRIDEKGGRRPVDPDILQTRQRNMFKSPVTPAYAGL